MIAFKEFAKKEYVKSVPCVQFSIRDDSPTQLNEAIHVRHFEEFRGPEDLTPESQGFVRVYHGIYTHPQHPQKLFGFHGSPVPVEYNDKAEAYSGYYNVDTKRHEALDAASDKLTKHYDPNSYSTAELDHVRRYTHFASNVNHRILNNTTIPEDAQHIHHLNSAILKHPIPDDMVVYSGTNKTHATTIKDNDVVHHPAFVSTSLSLWRAAKFANDKEGDLMAIHLPKGHPGLYAEHMSHMPTERELILPKGLHFKIDHSRRERLYYNSKPLTIHHVFPHHSK